ncbi:hypothetical protein AK830_g1014 [Neonectria ditissima]|uniref:Uncharacterized protein n=1 Tax=Neonectria ditissima TaxID=78410 RepID=A0A0P7B6M2_9HYPO|nr:hypothetical protein AK830_g1014 [Neonectria ditissima]
MPPRCAVLRSRAGWCTAPSVSPDGIWISDAMLRQAIERYHRSSSQTCRTLSSCPGPIESRRRLGKRHMTAIIPDSRSLPPPWSIEFPLRPGEWKWEAPNTVGERLQNRKKFSPRRLLDRLIGWLEDRSQDTPSPDMSAPQPRLVEAATASSFQRSIAELHQRIIALDLAHANEKAIWTACKPFLRRVRSSIRRRMISSEDLIIALDPFDSQVTSQVAPELLDAIRSRLATLLLRVIYITRAGLEHDAYTGEFWQASVNLLTELRTQQFEKYFYFFRLAQCIPHKRHELLTTALVRNMIVGFIEFQASLPFPHKHSTSHNVILSAAIRELECHRPAVLWKEVMGILNERHCGDDLLRHQRQAVMTMSFTASATSRECFSMYPCEWTSEDAFLFTKGRLWATRYLEGSSAPSFIHLDVAGLNWVKMVDEIQAAPKAERDILLKQLCRSTIKTGQFRLMAEQLVEKMPSNTRLFREIAIASGNYRKARLLWRLVRDRWNIRYIVHHWDWTAWTPYVEAMIKDPDINVNLIWEMLALNWNQPNEALPGRAMCGINSQTELLEMMGRWFLEADHLTERQALHCVVQCLGVYQSIDKKVSPRMLLCVIDVVIRDLERGQRGRQERLAWMVRLIRKHMGPREADDVLFQLQGWRWTIENRTQAPCKPTVKKIEEELKVLAREATRGGLRQQSFSVVKEPERELEVADVVEQEASSQS